jgi:hypothetical protein
MEKILVKISGDLWRNQKVLDWLKKMSQGFDITVCLGGGSDINRAFEEMGYPIEFGTLGRICRTFAQSLLAYEVLSNNKINFEKLLKANGINARVVIPSTRYGMVIKHENGDDYLCRESGYYRKYVLTLEDRLVAKQKQFERYPIVTVFGF